MLKLDISLFEQTPHLGYGMIMGCVLFVICSNKPNLDVFLKIPYLELTSLKAT